MVCGEIIIFSQKIFLFSDNYEFLCVKYVKFGTIYANDMLQVA